MNFFFLFFFFSLGGVFNLQDICSFAGDERLSCMKLETQCAIIISEDASFFINQYRKEEKQKTTNKFDGK